MKYWKVTKNEQDKPMLEHSKLEISETYWHNNAINYLLTNYLDDNKKRTCIDVGASYGWFTVPFSNIFNEVKSFEPRKDVYSCFLENTSHLNNVQSWNIGCGNDNTKVYFSADKISGFSHVSKTPTKKRIQLKTIDSLNFKNVDFIKIDVEGFEYDVLQGAKNTILKYKPLIMVEVHCKRDHASFNNRQNIFNFFKNINYEFLDLRGSDFIFKST